MSDLVRSKLLGWKSSLIDLSFRNPLLNFKPRKRTTLEIVSEIPSELFRSLFLDEKVMEFVEKSEKTSAVEEVEFRPYDRSTLSPNFSDRYLQTLLDRDELARQLVAIQRKSREWIEERGVNALFLTLGILEYHSVQSSDKSLRAPLVLLPVEMERPQLNRFQLKSTGESPFLNPALRKKLEMDFQIQLPDVPENTDQFVPEAYFAEIKDKVALVEKWKITNHTYLSFFHFQKFLMYKDLEENEELYQNSVVIQSICNPGNPEPVPDEILLQSPDLLIDPLKSFHVLDSDSSQQRVLLAFRTGRNLVVEGPPGTGKSQTIVNLIAEALANQKSVLFVSEKKAALDVVFRRLHQTGLNDFCLELHSNKTTRREVLCDIARVCEDQSLESPPNLIPLQTLTKLRNQLNTFVSELHTPFANLGLTPHELLSEIAALSDVPAVNAIISNVETLSKENFADVCRALNDYEVSLTVIGDPLEHPWSGCELASSTPLLNRQIILSLENTLQSFITLHNQLTQLTESAGITFPHKLGEIDAALASASLIANSPGATEEDLLNDEWNTIPPKAAQLIESLKLFQDLDSKCRLVFGESYRTEKDEFRKVAERCRNYNSDWFSFLRPQFWHDRAFMKEKAKRIKAFGKPEMAALGSDVVRCIESADFVCNNDHSGNELFRKKWKGLDSDVFVLENYASWMKQIHNYISQGKITAKGRTLASSALLNSQETAVAVQKCGSALSEFFTNLRKFVEVAHYSSADLHQPADTEVALMFKRLMELSDHSSELNRWINYRQNRQTCLQSIAGELVALHQESNHPPDLIEKAFRKRLYELLFDCVLKVRPSLQRFSGDHWELRIDEFKKLDQESIQLASRRLNHLLKTRRIELQRNQELQNQWAILSRFFKLKRIREPLRKIFNKVPEAIRLIKPCFLMSPLSVAEFLNPQVFQFDVVIFDEASQVTPEDAAGSLIRGKQIVVVGDSKQLPPTNFFSVQFDDPEESDELKDLESILDEFKIACGGALALRWHYRSRDESLIAFSNQAFYDSSLLTFPHANANAESLGLSFHHVQGIYEGSGINRAEAEAVKNAVFEHIRLHPGRSLGVATFGIGQMELIRDLVEEGRKKNTDCESFFQNHTDEPFFVKNLETIQGDERDVILLSFGYGPDEDARIRYNFGPINGENGWRRLNVLFTRAKYRMIVFASMSADQMSAAHGSGALLLKNFLSFVEKGAHFQKISENPFSHGLFEQAVKDALIKKGLNVVNSVGVSGYRIDLAVVDPNEPGRYLLGILCDGSTYSSAATARDRERLYHEALTERGWTLLRIWSIDWYINSDAQIQRILNAVEKAKNAELTLTKHCDIKVQPAESLAQNESPQRAISNNHLKLPKYTPASITRIGTPETIHEDESRLKEILFRVVSQEGPMHMNETRKRVAMHWGVSRLSKSIAEMIDKQIDALCEKDIVIKKGQFVRIKGTPVQPRNYPKNWIAEHIAPEEYVMAVRLILETYGAKQYATLKDDVGELMGFEQRSGDQLSECIGRAIEWMIENGIASRFNDRVELISK